MRRITFSLAAIAFALIAVRPGSADACINPVKLETSKAVKMIVQAEKDLSEGKVDKVLDALDKRKGYRHGMPGFPFELKDKALERRGEIILLTALIRNAKDDDVAGEHLKDLMEDAPEDPILIARYGELMSRAKDEKNRDKGFKALVDLETRDVMPDAEGWATLAAMYKAKNDKAWERAAAKCAKAAGKRANICPVVPTTKIETGKTETTGGK